MRKVRALLLSAAPLFLVGLLFFSFRSDPLPRTLRVGYFNFSPYMIPSPRQAPSGFTISVFEELARRRGIQLVWVDTTGRIEQALAAGEIDLYPLFLRTPARLSRFAFSDPWWQTTLVLVSPARQPVRSASELPGKTIGVFTGSYTAQIVQRLAPDARLVPAGAIQDVLEPVCAGRAHAAVAEARALQLLLARANRPCPGLDLHVQPIPEFTLDYGVAALPSHQTWANTLQDEILDMTIDGSLATIGARWNVYSTNQFGIFRDLLLLRNRTVVLSLTVLLLLLALLAFVRMYFQMRQAREIALAASQAQTRFLANITHEIRTPLNGILGMSQLLDSTELNTSQRDYLDAITASGNVLLNLINDFLDLAKIEAGHLHLESIPFSPESPAERVLQVLAPRAHQKQISLTCFIDPAVPAEISGDPTRLQQILFNLIGNAIKFTHAGSIALEVTRPQPTVLRFEIDDTGIGVPSEARSRLFARFEQADASTTRRFGGTGLGLAICRELVFLMKGTIGYTPLPTGSRFWFEIPIPPLPVPPAPRLACRVCYTIDDAPTRRLLARLLPLWGASLVDRPELADFVLEGPEWRPPLRLSRLRQALSAQSTPPAAQTIARPRLGLQILVAEDNAVNQRLLLTFLRKLGCDADLAADGKLAVDAAESKHYDVILMDCRMPVLDGFSATSQIRASAGPNRSTPIYAVTAGALNLHQEALSAGGFNGLLLKPYSFSALESLLREIPSSQSSVPAP